MELVENGPGHPEEMEEREDDAVGDLTEVEGLQQLASHQSERARRLLGARPLRELPLEERIGFDDGANLVRVALQVGDEEHDDHQCDSQGFDAAGRLVGKHEQRSRSPQEVHGVNERERRVEPAHP